MCCVIAFTHVCRNARVHDGSHDRRHEGNRGVYPFTVKAVVSEAKNVYEKSFYPLASR